MMIDSRFDIQGFTYHSLWARQRAAHDVLNGAGAKLPAKEQRIVELETLCKTLIAQHAHDQNIIEELTKAALAGRKPNLPGY